MHDAGSADPPRDRGASRPRCCLRPVPRSAQIVALVNGEPITALDIAQRTKLIQLSTQKTPSRQEVLDELIDDKLKVQLAQALHRRGAEARDRKRLRQYRAPRRHDARAVRQDDRAQAGSAWSR